MLWGMFLNDSPEEEEGMRYLIESLQVTNGWRHLQIVRKLVLEMRNQHAKLSSPVSNVVDTENEQHKKKIKAIYFFD